MTRQVGVAQHTLEWARISFNSFNFLIHRYSSLGNVSPSSHLCYDWCDIAQSNQMYRKDDIFARVLIFSMTATIIIILLADEDNHHTNFRNYWPKLIPCPKLDPHPHVPRTYGPCRNVLLLHSQCSVIGVVSFYRVCLIGWRCQTRSNQSWWDLHYCFRSDMIHS